MMAVGDMVHTIYEYYQHEPCDLSGIAEAHVIIEEPDGEVLTKNAQCLDDGRVAWNHLFKPGLHKIQFAFIFENGDEMTSSIGKLNVS